MSSLTLTLGAKNREKENNLRKRNKKQEENEKRTKSTSCNSDTQAGCGSYFVTTYKNNKHTWKQKQTDKKKDKNNKLKPEKREKYIKIFTLYCQRK